jgi:sortase A
VISKIVRTTGELLITVGLVILLFVAYELWGTGLETARAQNHADSALEQLWRERVPDPVEAKPGQPAPKIPLGTGLARIWVPRFGTKYHWVIGEGVSLGELKKGPGHYPGTELPGQVGNFVVSGHRTTYGAPFNKVDKLKIGDAIIIETKSNWFTYRVTDADIVRPTQVEVTWAVPYKAKTNPTKAMITLTSCHPKFSARRRYVVFGELESRLSKASGEAPPALAEG